MVRFLDYMATPRNLIGASILRIVFATSVAATYAMHIDQRAFLWGPHGQFALPDDAALIQSVHGWSLYLLSSSEAWFEFVFWSGLVVTLLYLVGAWTRLTGLLFLVYTWSFFSRNDYVLNGGTTALILASTFLVVADTGRYFAMDAARESARASRPGVWSDLFGILHNAAVLAVLLELCVIYVESTFYKTQGNKWQNGTALYYILRSNQFDLSAAGRLVYHDGILVTLATYGTLLFQSAFPWLCWQRRAKWLVIAGAVVLHGGIAWTMGLVWFSATIVAYDALLVPDESYLSLGAWLAQRLRKHAALPETVPDAV